MESLYPDKTIERFWAKVNRMTGSSCWVWTGGTRGDGGQRYGKITVKGRAISAHRFSYELHNGTIPGTPGAHGSCVCHRCDNPLCVNPAHLFLGSHLENMQDKKAKGRDTSANKTHCRHGHVRNTDNTYTTRTGLKSCRVCHRLNEQRRRAQNRDKERKAC